MLVLLGERGANIGSACSQLLRLLDEHGGVTLEREIQEASEKGLPEPNSVCLILDCTRIDEQRPVRKPVDLPGDARIKQIVVKPHALSNYDVLGRANETEGGQIHGQFSKRHRPTSGSLSAGAWLKQPNTPRP